jgi:hypothetical protein
MGLFEIALTPNIVILSAAKDLLFVIHQGKA